MTSNLPLSLAGKEPREKAEKAVFGLLNYNSMDQRRVAEALGLRGAIPTW